MSESKPVEATESAAVRNVAAGAVLDLGCGPRKARGEWVGVDCLAAPGVDIVGDVYVALEALPDGAVEGVHAAHFLEHLDDLDRIMREIVRVVRPGGGVEVIVPHFSNPYYYSDMTHRTFFGLYTFSYMLADSPFRRTVPHYGSPLPLKLASAELVFKSSPPFYGRYALKRAIGLVVNSSRWTQEFYEENLVWLAPCYELRFKLVRTGSGA